MNDVFIYEILILIKTKNINVCCFQVITNQTNHDYLYQLAKRQARECPSFRSFYYAKCLKIINGVYFMKF